MYAYTHIKNIYSQKDHNADECFKLDFHDWLTQTTAHSLLANDPTPLQQILQTISLSQPLALGRAVWLYHCSTSACRNIV
jgi:hypothetical protein